MKKKVLIIKTGAAGDVVRTTSLIHLFNNWEIDWFAGERSMKLLPWAWLRNVSANLNDFRAENYDLVINLEDDLNLATQLDKVIQTKRSFGTTAPDRSAPPYSEDSSRWYDMGLNSRHGIGKANQLKLDNRQSYQEILYQCFGSKFSGEPYILPDFSAHLTGFVGDIAIAPTSGDTWPMKNWPFYDELYDKLSRKYKVNLLPFRRNILEHVADISGHKLLVTGDSLPMHVALALKIKTVAIFTCTSPWEIYEYGVLRKLISAKLAAFFYHRGYDQSVFDSLPLTKVETLVENLMIEIRECSGKTRTAPALQSRQATSD